MEEELNSLGRPKWGKYKDEKTIRLNPRVPESVYNRLIKFCEEEERALQWVITKSLDKFLEEKGY